MPRLLSLAAMVISLPALAQDLTVDGGTSVTLSGTSSFGNVVVEPGGTLVIDGTLNLTGNLTVKASGVVRQSLGTPQTIISAPSGIVDVQFGGAIDMTGVGLLGGNQVGNGFGSAGQSLNPTTFALEGTAGLHRGGSYGGRGGNAGPAAYGVQATPLFRGGGGGGGDFSGKGGNGGGALRIDASTVQVDGTLRVDGAVGTVGAAGTGGAGGAGGAIYITAATFSGTGSVSAQGGVGAPNGTGGGGGRIAIVVTTYSFTGGVIALGAGLNSPGPGSVYIKEGGTFRSVGGYVDLGAGDSATAVLFGPAGTFRISGTPTITNPVSIGAGATVELNTSDALTNVTLVSPVNGTLVVNAPITQPASLTINGGLTLNAELTVNGNLIIAASGAAGHAWQNKNFSIVASGTVDVQGQISVTGAGLPQGQAIDPVTKLVVTGSGQYAGGSHGGRGGDGAPNPVYGLQNNPVDLGSGGGVGDFGGPGGAGGGRIRITAATLKCDGNIFADGANGGPGAASRHGAGGSGGTIKIDVATLQGAGLISARGGNSASSGGGGGGRIAIGYTTSSFTGSVNAAGGNGSVRGGDGSVQLLSAANALRVSGGTYSLDAASSFASITLLPGAALNISGAAQVASQLNCTSGTTVTLSSSDALTNINLAPTIFGTLRVSAPSALGALSVPGVLIVNAPTTTGALAVGGQLVVNSTLTLPTLDLSTGALMTHDDGQGDMVVNASGTVTVSNGATIDVTGKGLGPTTAYDPITLNLVSGSTSYSGGSHGGLGGGGSPNPIYGNQSQPDLLGSGGSNGDFGSQGGRGGGRLRLTAATLQLDGAILSKGLTATNGAAGRIGGAGSGGSVWISVNDFKGSGYAHVIGGAGGPSGGGGGGRLAIDYATSSFAGTTSAIGGSGTPAGNPGTVDLHSTATSSDLVLQAGEYHLKGTDSFNSVTLLSGAILHVDGSASIAQPLAIPTGTSVWLNVSTATQNIVLPSQVDGTLVVNAPYSWPGPHVLTGTVWARAALATGNLDMRAGSTLTVDQQVDVAGDLVMTAPSTIRHSVGVRTMDLRVENRLVLPFGAVIDGNAAGLPGGNRSGFGCPGAAIDPASKLTVSGAAQFGGGSFGGSGANTTNPVYGSATDMEYPGSGGGCGDFGGGGGNGGGIVRVTARQFDAFGIVRSNGGGPTPAPAAGSWGGAGSGGAILVKATEMNGTGVVQVNGGSSPRAGGGAGRIRVEVSTNNFTGVLEANGGSGASGQGGAGSTATVVATQSVPIIVSTAATVATLAAAWSYDADGLPAAVGTQPLTWSLVSGPPSASVNASTGAVTWTPVTLGIANFTLRATNAVGFGEQQFSVQVMEPPAVVGTGVALAQIGAPYHYNASDTLVVTGSAPFTYSTTLAPPGSPAMTVDSTGKVTWTPSTQGTFTPCIRVANQVGQVDHCFTVTAQANLTPPSITSTPPLSVQVNQPYSYQLVATGTAPITFAFLPGAAPAGATIGAATGAIAWTPAQVGSGFFCVEAMGVGSDTQCWSVTVDPPPIAPQIVSACYPLATAGQAYHYDADDSASATGSAPISWSLFEPPQGMAIDAAGKIAWTPAGAGAVSFGVVATNDGGSFTQPCTVTVRPVGQVGPPVILRLANPVAAVGFPYRYDVTGNVRADGDQPITYSKVAGPAKLSVDPGNGHVGWVPAAAGPETITVKATNGSGSDSYTFTVGVLAIPGVAPVAVVSGGPWSGDAPLTVNVDGSLSTPGADLLSWSWDFGDGSAPVEGQKLTHVYSACGGYTARLTVTDNYGQQHTDDRQVQVSCAGVLPPAARIVATELVGNGSKTVSFSCDCKVGSAALSGYRWQATDGFFSDQPTDQHAFVPGGHTLTLVVVDANGLSAQDRIFISVPDASGNEPPFVAISASPPGGAPPVSITYSSNYGDGDGFISSAQWTFGDGTTTSEAAPVRAYGQVARESVLYAVTDNGGLTSSASLEVLIGDPSAGELPEIISVPRKSLFAGEAYSYDKDGLPTVRGTGPFTFKLPTAPTGATLDEATGKISWTPAVEVSGDQDFALEVTGKAGTAVQEWKVTVVSLGVSAAPVTSGCGCNGLGGSLAALALLALAPWLSRRRR